MRLRDPFLRFKANLSKYKTPSKSKILGFKFGTSLFVIFKLKLRFESDL
jgi:hypothetical protein